MILLRMHGSEASWTELCSSKFLSSACKPESQHRFAGCSLRAPGLPLDWHNTDTLDLSSAPAGVCQDGSLR